MPDVPVLVEMGGGVAEITLNRPGKMNALTPEMLVRLDQAWAEISKDPEIRVVILTGAGERAFCAGADLGRLTPLLTRARPAEDESIKVVLRSADAREGSRAFIEKRPPHFTGA